MWSLCFKSSAAVVTLFQSPQLWSLCLKSSTAVEAPGQWSSVDSVDRQSLSALSPPTTFLQTGINIIRSRDGKAQQSWPYIDAYLLKLYHRLSPLDTLAVHILLLLVLAVLVAVAPYDQAKVHSTLPYYIFFLSGFRNVHN